MYIQEPVLHHRNEFMASTDPDTGVAYMGGKGALPSKDWVVFYDDFIHDPASNAPEGWTAIIDTSATVIQHATDLFPGGVLQFKGDAAPGEGAAIYLPKCMQIGTREWFIEIRAQLTDADDGNLQFGLSALNAVTNPEDLFTTASTDLIAFGVLDGDATVKSLIDKNNGGTSAVTGTIDLEDATWATLAIHGKGAEWVDFYVNGVKSHRDVVVATIPDDLLLAPFIAFTNGSAAGDVGLVDWMRFAIER